MSSNIGATIADGDVLFLPANTLALEQVGDDAVTYGLRFAMVLARDNERFKTFNDLASNKLTPSTHVSKGVVAAAAIGSMTS